MYYDLNNPYYKLVSTIVNILEDKKSYKLGGFHPTEKPNLSPKAPKVLLFSPHPDDECITGALPLRLLRELLMRVINVPVTLGSRVDRKQERFDELTGACSYLGFELLPIRENGLENIRRSAKEQYPEIWKQAVAQVSAILTANCPSVIFFPHETDKNTTHSGTNLLVLDALATMDSDFSCHVIETEYWSPMSDPNLMVESSVRDVVDLITAISFHIGEVNRNPYHLSQPAWMVDNVRRGSELVGIQGGDAPRFIFATIYRLRKWVNGEMTETLQSNKILSAADDLSSLQLT